MTAPPPLLSKRGEGDTRTWKALKREEEEREGKIYVRSSRGQQKGGEAFSRTTGDASTYPSFLKEGGEGGKYMGKPAKRRRRRRRRWVSFIARLPPPPLPF